MFDDGLLRAAELLVAEDVLQHGMGRGQRGGQTRGQSEYSEINSCQRENKALGAVKALIFARQGLACMRGRRHIVRCKKAGARLSTIGVPMQALHYTRAALPAILAQRIVILDGAMGTMIQRFKLGEAQVPGRATPGQTARVTGSRTLPAT